MVRNRKKKERDFDVIKYINIGGNMKIYGKCKSTPS